MLVLSRTHTLPTLGALFLATLDAEIAALQDAADYETSAAAAWEAYALSIESEPALPQRPELPSVDSKWSGFSLVYTVIGCQARTHDRDGQVYLMHPLQSEWLVLEAHEFWDFVACGYLEHEPQDAQDMNIDGTCKGCGSDTGGKMSCSLTCPIDGEVA